MLYTVAQQYRKIGNNDLLKKITIFELHNLVFKLAKKAVHCFVIAFFVSLIKLKTIILNYEKTISINCISSRC